MTGVPAASPWRLPVRPTCEPFRVRLSGPGASSRGLPASLPTQFTIDTRQAGFGDLEAQVMVSGGEVSPIDHPSGYPLGVGAIPGGRTCVV